jgi:uncharacterized OB-fold protein
MTNIIDVARTPSPVLGLYDRPMWDSIQERAMKLPHCQQCQAVHYPPGPVCPDCLSSDLQWQPLSGDGTILSWTVFHRTYLEAYPAPYNVIAVKLAEGPTMISNLEPLVPEQIWIGAPVKLVYSTMPDGVVLPRFVLDTDAQK